MTMRTIKRCKQLFVYGIVSLLMSAPLALAQETDPPAPEVPASEHVNPAPVGPGSVQVIEALPENLPLAFYLIFGQEALLGDWDITGEVVLINEDRMVLQTEDNVQAVLLYRLPGGETLEVEVGEMVRIVRVVFPVDVSWGWAVEITSIEKGFVAGGVRVFGDQPQTVEIAGGQIAVIQADDRGLVLADTNTDTTFAVPAVLQMAQGEVPLVPGTPVPVPVNQRFVLVELISSAEIVPDAGAEASAEGSPFTLEFAATAITPL